MPVIKSPTLPPMHLVCSLAQRVRCLLAPNMACFASLHFSKSKNFGTFFNIMAAFARRKLPIGRK